MLKRGHDHDVLESSTPERPLSHDAMDMKGAGVTPDHLAKEGQLLAEKGSGGAKVEGLARAHLRKHPGIFHDALTPSHIREERTVNHTGNRAHHWIGERLLAQLPKDHPCTPPNRYRTNRWT